MRNGRRSPMLPLSVLALVLGANAATGDAAVAACPPSSAYSQKILGTTGLVGYWRLGEASGGTACDSKNGDTGVYQPGTVLGRPGAIPGDPDTAVGFDGVTGWVSAPDRAALDVGDSFTAEAWTRRGSLSSSSTQVIVSKQHGSWVLLFDLYNRLVLRRSTIGDVVASSATVADTTTWHHVAATKSGATVQLYLDGRDVTGTPSNQTMVDNAQPLSIGQSAGASFYKGDIDEVAVYAVPLTPTQIADHYAAGAPPRPVRPPSNGDPVIAAAGDIACDPADAGFNGGAGTTAHCRQAATSDLLAANGPTGVLALGDNQYVDGTMAKFNQVFGATWGRFKSLTHPTVGNHEYNMAGAGGYYDYFNGPGTQAGPAGDRSNGYYSYDIGTWHVVALNSNCSVVGGCGVGSRQEQWLRADLAAHPAACTLAHWHHPRFSSGWSGNATPTAPLFQDLYDANADVVLAGHDHNYERFGPQTPSGVADPARGIRAFTVGTGGEDFGAQITVRPNSQVRGFNTFGVLSLTLHPSSYDWEFVPIAGQMFNDSGTSACH